MKEKTIDFPDCWEEVKPCEWEYLLKLRMLLVTKEGISLKDIKREWCRFVLKNRGIPKNGAVDYYVLIYNLSLTLDWMWKEHEDGNTVELTFQSTQNLLPNWRNLKGPLSHGSDITFAEFRTAVNLMNNYISTKEAWYLPMLCGMLYRKPGKKFNKKDFDGRYREPFNPHRLDLYAARVRNMPEYIQWGIYAWFAYFCEYLISETFIIEGVEICFAPLFKRDAGGNQSGEQSLGMNGILFSVAESGIFGNTDQTDDTLLLKVLLKLLDDHQRAKAMLPKSATL